MPVNQRKQDKNMPLQGLLRVRRGEGSFDLASDSLSFLCSKSVSFSNSSGCISDYGNIIMKKKSFLLPQPVIIDLAITSQKPMEVTYYSDCVFKPYVHKFTNEQIELQQCSKLILNFQFLPSAVKSNPKILDNIGVLKISQNERYGILVTKQKEGLFISLID